MGQCTRCGRKGLFVFVDTAGLCKHCTGSQASQASPPQEHTLSPRTASSSSDEVAALRQIEAGAQGSLSPAEIVFLWYLDKADAAQELPQYLSNDYHINKTAVTQKLFRYGYLSFMNGVDKLPIQRVTELKEMLSTHGLSTSGRKDLLIARLKEAVPEPAIDAMIPTDYFALTEAGRDLVTANDHLVYCHQHRSQFDLSLETADSIRWVHPDFDRYDVALELLRMEGLEHWKEKDWGLWRNTLLNRATVHQERAGKDDRPLELKLLLQVCYLDAAGYGNGGTQNEDLSILAPTVINRLVEIYDECLMNKPGMRALFLTAAKSNELPQWDDMERAFAATWEALETRRERLREKKTARG